MRLMGHTYRPVRENRDPLALAAWQYAQQWEDFIPTPLGEAKEWLADIATTWSEEYARHARILLEELEWN